MVPNARPAALAVLIVAGLLLPSSGQARDTVHTFTVGEAITHGLEQGALVKTVGLFFAGQQHAPVARAFGEHRTNKKTNAFNKSDKEACEWALLSALRQLQFRALDLGGDAVVDIKSNYRNREFASATEYQCGAGNVVAGVALKGTVVKLKQGPGEARVIHERQGLSLRFSPGREPPRIHADLADGCRVARRMDETGAVRDSS